MGTDAVFHGTASATADGHLASWDLLIPILNAIYFLYRCALHWDTSFATVEFMHCYIALRPNGCCLRRLMVTNHLILEQQISNLTSPLLRVSSDV